VRDCVLTRRSSPPSSQSQFELKFLEEILAQIGTEMGVRRFVSRGLASFCQKVHFLTKSGKSTLLAPIGDGRHFWIKKVHFLRADVGRRTFCDALCKSIARSIFDGSIFKNSTSVFTQSIYSFKQR